MHRNKQIEDMKPSEYQFMFHLKNLRKIENFKGLKNYKLSIEENDVDINGKALYEESINEETEWFNS